MSVKMNKTVKVNNKVFFGPIVFHFMIDLFLQGIQREFLLNEK